MPGSGWKVWSKSLSCKSQNEGKVHSPTPMLRSSGTPPPSSRTPSLRGCSRSLANLKGVIHGNTKVVHKSASSSPEEPLHLNIDSPPTPPPAAPPAVVKRSTSNRAAMRLGGCHGCHVADEAFVFRTADGVPYATRLHRLPATCPHCGTSFATYEALEHHNATRHAVHEARAMEFKVIEQIWLKNGSPGLIDRILRVNNSKRTLSRYRDYQELVKLKARAEQKFGRCPADGFEQLGFYAAAVTCDLGAFGLSSICTSPACAACRIIRSGFQLVQPRRKQHQGIRISATCGRAHHAAITSTNDQEQRHYAMLVCRVIAGRMHKGSAVDELPSGFDSVAGNFDDLYVFSPKALIADYVVIYKW